MQLRKGLIAAATATAVLTSGVTVASAETEKPVVVNTTDKKTTESNQTTQSTSSGSSSDPDREKLTPKEIQDWIAVATAIIGLLGTLFTFADKFLKP